PRARGTLRPPLPAGEMAPYRRGHRDREGGSMIANGRTGARRPTLAASFVTATLALLVAAGSLPAQVAPVATPVAAALVGAWQGALALPTGQSLTIVVHFDTAGSALAATMDNPDQGASGIPVGEVSFDGA